MTRRKLFAGRKSCISRKQPVRFGVIKLIKSVKTPEFRKSGLTHTDLQLLNPALHEFWHQQSTTKFVKSVEFTKLVMFSLKKGIPTSV